MFRAMLALSFVAYSLTALGQSQSDPVRVYADSMARAIVASDEQTIYDNFAPIMRSAYSREKLLAPLKVIRGMFGDISHYEYRSATVGGQLVAGRTIRTATCWYAATTTKLSTGTFLKVAVTYDHARFYLAGYSVDRFVGDHIPPGLQGLSKQ